jgi:hypothetical protein
MLDDPELSRALALRAIKGQLLRVKWLVAATRFEIAKELQNAVTDVSQAGYQDHHIVEQTSAETDGHFSRELIDSRDNGVRIPTMRHEDINGWYSKPNDEYGGMSPRDYLRDKSWDERRSVGLKALIENEVLKP